MSPLSVKKGMTTLTASTLRESPGALPAVSRAAQYAGIGYSFAETMFTLGPRAAIGFLRMRASAYTFACTTAFLACGYYLTTDRVRLSSHELILQTRMSQQSADQAIVKRNRLTGTETLVEVHPDPTNGSPVYRRPHVNRLLYTYNVYKPPKEDWLMVDLDAELSADRFCADDQKRHRTQKERAIAEAVMRSQKNNDEEGGRTAVVGSSTGSNDGPLRKEAPTYVALRYVSRVERMTHGDMGQTFAVREALSNAVKALIAEGYRACIHNKCAGTSESAAGGVHPVLAEMHIRNGSWDGSGISAEDVIRHVGDSPDIDIALKNFETRVSALTKERIGKKAILMDVHLSLRKDGGRVGQR